MSAYIRSKTFFLKFSKNKISENLRNFPIFLKIPLPKFSKEKMILIEFIFQNFEKKYFLIKFCVFHLTCLKSCFLTNFQLRGIKLTGTPQEKPVFLLRRTIFPVAHHIVFNKYSMWSALQPNVDKSDFHEFLHCILSRYWHIRNQAF